MEKMTSMQTVLISNRVHISKSAGIGQHYVNEALQKRQEL